MSVKVKAVTTDGVVHDILGGYGDMDGACGDTRGDLWGNIHDAIGDCDVVELRFVASKPIKLRDKNEEDEDGEWSGFEVQVNEK